MAQIDGHCVTNGELFVIAISEHWNVIARQSPLRKKSRKFKAAVERFVDLLAKASNEELMAFARHEFNQISAIPATDYRKVYEKLKSAREMATKQREKAIQWFTSCCAHLPDRTNLVLIIGIK